MCLKRIVRRNAGRLVRFGFGGVANVRDAKVNVAALVGCQHLALAIWQGDWVKAVVRIEDGIAIGVLLSMDWIRRGSNSCLVERHGDNLMAAEVADVADLDGEIFTGLPLNIEGVVDGVRQFVGAVIDSEWEDLRSCLNLIACWQVLNDVSGIAGWNETEVRRSEGSANLGVHERWSLIDAKRATRDAASRKARRKIGEEFAAIIVEPGAGANNELAVKHFGTPGNADAWSESPLAAGECC